MLPAAPDISTLAVYISLKIKFWSTMCLKLLTLLSKIPKPNWCILEFHLKNLKIPLRPDKLQWSWQNNIQHTGAQMPLFWWFWAPSELSTWFPNQRQLIPSKLIRRKNCRIWGSSWNLEKPKLAMSKIDIKILRVSYWDRRYSEVIPAKENQKDTSRCSEWALDQEGKVEWCLRTKLWWSGIKK